MKEKLPATETLSPWWRRSVVLVFVCGMAVLIFMSVQAYRYAPPIPESVVDSAGKVVFNRQDIESGQQVFLKYALMQNGSIWGHGSYLGPDFSAAYLHELALDTGNAIARAGVQHRFDGARRGPAVTGRRAGRQASQGKSLRPRHRIN